MITKSFHQIACEHLTSTKYSSVFVFKYVRATLLLLLGKLDGILKQLA